MSTGAADRRQWVTFLILSGITLFIAFLFFRILSIFILPLFLALVLVIIFQPVFSFFLAKFRNRRGIAAAATTAIVVLGVVFPALLLLWLSLAEAMSIMSQIGLGGIPQRLQQVRKNWGLEMPYELSLRRIDQAFERARGELEQQGVISVEHVEACSRLLEQLRASLRDQHGALFDRLILPVLQQIKEEKVLTDSDQREDAFWRLNRSYLQFRSELLGGPAWQWVIEIVNPSDDQRRAWRRSLQEFVQSYLVPLGGATAAFVAKAILSSVITIIALFFFFYDGPTMLAAILRLIPLPEEYEQELAREFTSVTRTVVLATLASAIAQAVLACLAFWFIGFQSVFMLTALTLLCALIPFIGASTVWVPCVLWLYFVDERWVAAVALFIYGAFVISLIDNIIKPWILHGQARLHPLLALLSVLGGVQALGAIGILVGPMTVVFLQTALRIMHRELLGVRSSEPAGTSSGETAASKEQACDAVGP